MSQPLAVIIGGSGGIGRAIAHHLSEKNYRIVITSRVQTRAEQVALAINEQGGEAYAIPLDVTNSASIIRVAKQIHDELGPIDALIHAYGKGVIQATTDVKAELALEVLNTNVLGSYWVTQAFIEHMNAEHARMIYFPGTMGKYIMRNSALYSASKFAIQGMVKGWVEEYKRTKTQFSLLYLGGVDTPFWDDEDVQMRVKKEAMLNPDVIAGVVGNLLALPSSHVINEIVLQPESHQLV
jgi:3-oxoacyl-[acyl-carrier protein] reductase